MNTLSAQVFTPTRILPTSANVPQVCDDTLASQASVASLAIRHTPSRLPPVSKRPCRTRKQRPSGTRVTPSVLNASSGPLAVVEGASLVA